MDRIAVFVDAGYLYAQGSVALAGSKQARSQLSLDEIAAVAELTAFSLAREPGTSLLRIYWYDGFNVRETPEQKRIAEAQNVKIRLGVINNFGEQKGVDSLIVTDMVELARTGSISAAVLLSGDEDVRIGVEIAQKYGVRVHLLGIIPSRGSQSAQLLREADTTSEWDSAVIAKLLTLAPLPVTAAVHATVPVTTTPAPVAFPVKGGAAAAAPAPSSTQTVTPGTLDDAAATFASALNPSDIPEILEQWDGRGGIAPTFDGRLLATARTALQRDLEQPEKRLLRSTAIDKLRGLQSSGEPPH